MENEIRNQSETFNPLFPNMSTTGPNLTTPRPGDGESSSGPSWGLIIPIVMIGVFLLCVVLCLWWHKWRDRKGTLHIQRNSNGTNFQRSYRGSRGSRGSDLDTIRDSMRSTTPLRNSMSEKASIGSSNSGVYPAKKLNNVNVVPIQRTPNGKYSFYWDKTQWKPYQVPGSAGPRAIGKPLSPINEIDSPNSMKLSERSKRSDVGGQQSYSSYNQGSWTVPSSGIPSYEQSLNMSHLDNSARYPPYPSQLPNGYPYGVGEPQVNSPFYPNNNTPTTECDSSSEASHTVRSGQGRVCSHCSPYINVNQLHSNAQQSSNTGSTETEVHHSRSLASSYPSYPESSYETSCPSGFHTSTVPPSSEVSNLTEQQSSLPSSIAQFSKEHIMMDENNNSNVVPNAYISFTMARAMDFSLASSVESSDTHFSDNTSLLPNMGSNNTSTYPPTIGSRSLPHSTEQSGRVSPEDLSKLVDEMSSIRPVEESTSTKPNTSVDRQGSRIASISGNSLSAEFYRSWSIVGGTEQPSLTSVNTSGSQCGSMYWDNYPISESQRLGQPCAARTCLSHLDLPLLLHTTQPPVLMEKQYWV